jgi:hypothetical protein
MKNRYVSFKCPSCMSTVQMKTSSVRSDFFYCPVCETGEIESPITSLIIDCQKIRLCAKQPIPVRV